MTPRLTRRKFLKASANGAALAFVSLLEVVATNFPGRPLAWDAGTMRFTGNDEADSLLAATYREDF